MGNEQIRQAGVRSVHHKIAVSVSAPGIGIRHDRHGLRPLPVGAADASVPILILHGIGQHILDSLHAEFRTDRIKHRLRIQTVVAVILGNGFLNGLLAGDVGLIGFSVQRQFSMLTGIGCIMPV